jgi:hypothetical protein
VSGFTVEYEGIPCPVPNCRGFLKAVPDGSTVAIRCEFGHLVQTKPSGLVAGFAPRLAVSISPDAIPAAGIVRSGSPVSD